MGVRAAGLQKALTNEVRRSRDRLMHLGTVTIHGNWALIVSEALCSSTPSMTSGEKEVACLPLALPLSLHLKCVTLSGSRKL